MWAAILPAWIGLDGHRQTLIIAALLVALAFGVYCWIRRRAVRGASPEPETLSAIRALATILVPVWFLLVAHTLWGLWQLSAKFDPSTPGVDLRWHVLAFIGLVTALGGLVSAPLALIRVWTTERQTRTSEQGHMTDRISKAVEQLGAEKSVKRDGKAEETVRNIEVRIGGLLSLERIAQDSTRYDKGRDHVRVMEILCAYVRENAPAEDAMDSIRKKWEDETAERKLPDGEMARVADDDSFCIDHQIHPEHLEDLFSVKAQTKWAQSLPEPRADIAIALRIIGRRGADQRRAEARSGPDATDTAGWVYDLPCPELPDPPKDKRHPTGAIKAFEAKLKAWTQEISGYRGYVPDLRKTNLQKADLSNLTLSGANLTGARIEGADLRWARMEGADLTLARMEGANLWDARMEGAVLWEARMEGANLGPARMVGAFLRQARMEGANLRLARLEGADLTLARMEGAYLRGARLEGANLSWARMDATTDLTDAYVSSASVREVDYTNVALSQEQIDGMFGDASVHLPKDRQRPEKWPKWELPFGGKHNFDDEWRKWQKNPEGYEPPDPPE